MPLIKSAALRYRILNSCFTQKQKRYWSIPELLKKLNDHDIIVERRTVEGDLRAMRHDNRLAYYAPIDYCRKNKGHYYTQPGYSINAASLSNEDIHALTVAASVLQQYKGAQFVKQFEGTLDKVARFVDLLKRESGNSLISFETAPYYKGYGYFDKMIEALYQKKPLRITYRKFFENEERDHIFHSYSMKEYRGRWYVQGYSEARDNIIILGLDRMEHVADANVSFRENETLNPNEYFQHIIGVTLGKGPVEKIILKISPLLAPYIRTQHIHHTQYILQDNSHGILLTLHLIPNYELVQLLLGYGRDIDVLEPLTLKEKLRRQSNVSGFSEPDTFT